MSHYLGNYQTSLRHTMRTMVHRFALESVDQNTNQLTKQIYTLHEVDSNLNSTLRDSDSDTNYWDSNSDSVKSMHTCMYSLDKLLRYNSEINLTLTKISFKGSGQYW